MTSIRSIILISVVLAALAAGFLLYPAGGVPILAYHKVGAENERYSIGTAEFEAHMRYLRDAGYEAVSLAELTEGLSGRRKLPDRPVVITFDDGYEDNFLTALPIMKKYGMRATVFVLSGRVGQPSYMTWEQIRAIRQHGVEIGSHTYSHAALTEISESERLYELAESKAVLERELGEAVEFIAYPYGKFDAAIFGLLQQTGYKAACTGLPGLNFAGENPYTLKRINIPRPKFGLWEFKLRLARANLYARLHLLGPAK